MQAIDPVELTRQLVGFTSANPPGDEEDCARFLAQLLEQAGFAVQLHSFGERRFNLLARIAGQAGGAPLGFTGHLDTVPLGTAEWQHAPYGGEVVDGKLYGRGSSDMKGGIAAFIAACVPLLDHLRQGSGLQLVLTGGEETGCDGAHALIAAQPACLVPLGALIVGEPTGNRALIGHKGALWLNATARGVTAHGAMPEQGVNAIYAAADALVKIRSFEVGPAHALMGAPTLNVGTIQGGLNINSVPDQTSFSIDIRSVPGIEHRCVSERLKAHLGNIELAPLIDLPAVYSDPAHSWIARVTQLAHLHGEPCTHRRTVQYFTDAAVLTPATGHPPTIILGPGESDMAHKTDEYCRVDRLHQAVRLYSEILRDWVAHTAAPKKV